MSPPDGASNNPSRSPTPSPGPGAPCHNDPLEPDDGDYELEPLDPNDTSPAHDFAREDIQAATESIDVNQFYNDYDRGFDLDGTFKGFKFQFQIRHLMLLTAGLAVMLSLWRVANFAGVLIVGVVVLSMAHLYLAHQERRRQAAVLAKRNRMAEAARRRREGESMYDQDLEDEDAISNSLTLPELPPLELNFSLKQLMIALTVACVVMGVFSALPLTGLLSVQLVAGILGIAGVVGIATYIMGYDPPPVVALVWWMVMAMYVVLSVASHLLSSA